MSRGNGRCRWLGSTSEEHRRMMDRESMTRTTDIAIMASERTTTRPHVHGVEPTFASKFWASTDDDSSIELDDDESTTPKLMTPKVCSKLDDGSISK
jgi:hypothetical protein